VAQVFLGVLLLGGALAACGDDASSTAEEPQATVTVTETPTPTPTPTPSETASEVPSPTPTESAPPKPPSTEAPRTYDDAMARFDALGQEPAAYLRFTTEADIYCVLDDKELPASCELGERDGAQDPKVCGEALTTKVGRIEMQDGRATPVCNTDTIRGDMPDVLNPGEAARAGDVQCLNDLGGIVCVSLSSDAGFFMRPGEYAVFNAG